MADLPSALRARLSAETQIIAAVGTRIYPVIRAQGSPLPSIAYFVPGGARGEHLKGYTGTRRPRVHISCYSHNYGSARQLAEIVTVTLALPTTVAGVQFGRGSADEPRDGGGADTPDGYVHLVTVDLFIEYRLL